MIIHIDGDAFFASCEMARDISLRNKKVVVGEEKGIATAVSYSAKKAGVTRGMPIFEIRKLFKDVIVKSSDFDLYRRMSKRVMNIASRYMPYIEEYSIDECFCESNEDDEVVFEKAKQMQIEISRKLGLTVSVGVSKTKVLAKIASKRNKPNGLTILVSEQEIQKYLNTVPIGGVWGIGRETSQKLQRIGVSTAHDFISLPRERVESTLSKPYIAIWYELQGKKAMDFTTKSNIEDRKSVQDTQSFKSTKSKVFLKGELSRHTDEASSALRNEGLLATYCSFYLKTKGGEYFRKDFSLPIPTSNPASVYKIISKKFEEIYNENMLYKSVGVLLGGLIHKDSVGTDLFGDKKSDDNWTEVMQKVDMLRNKIGRHIIGLADTIGGKGVSKESYSEKLPLIYLGEFDTKDT